MTIFERQQLSRIEEYLRADDPEFVAAFDRGLAVRAGTPPREPAGLIRGRPRGHYVAAALGLLATALFVLGAVLDRGAPVAAGVLAVLGMICVATLPGWVAAGHLAGPREGLGGRRRR